jgi:hypothetical protein
MNNTIIFILSVFDIFSELIEATYDLGSFTRNRIIPALIYTYCFIEFYSMKVWDVCTSDSFYYGELETVRMM